MARHGSGNGKYRLLCLSLFSRPGFLMIGLRIQFSGELKYTLPCKGQVAGLPFGQGSQDLTEFAGGAASSLTYRENVADGDLPSQVKVIGLPIYHTGVEAGIEAPFDCYCCGEKVAREGLWPGALLLCKRCGIVLATRRSLACTFHFWSRLRDPYSSLLLNTTCCARSPMFPQPAKSRHQSLNHICG